MDSTVTSDLSAASHLAAVAFDDKDHIRDERPPLVCTEGVKSDLTRSQRLSAPLDATLESHLLGHIRQQHELCNAAVLRVLMQDCNLMQHLSALRSCNLFICLLF